MAILGVLLMPALPPSGDDSELSGKSVKNGGSRASTILVVEDDPLIRMTIAEHLRDGGFRVLEASDAQEALQIFGAAEPIELMISDINMPGMDGAALATWVQANFPDVRIVVVSGAPSNKARVPGVVFVEKPFALDMIERLVRSLLVR